MNKSEKIGELSLALAKAQAAFQPVKKSCHVDFTTLKGQRVKYSYAPLEDVFNACRKSLAENEIAVMQPTRLGGDSIIVETILAHSSGEWLSGEISITPADHNPQSEGSALTYARRYGLSAMLGIASEEDDDAEQTMARDTKPKAKVDKSIPLVQPVAGELSPNNPYINFGETCFEHGDEWFTNKFGKRCHKMPDGSWCNFADIINREASKVANEALMDADMTKKWIADNYEGKTWSKLGEDKQIEAICRLWEIANSLNGPTPIIEAKKEGGPEVSDERD